MSAAMVSDTTISNVIGAILAIALVLWLAHRIGSMARRQGRSYRLWLVLGIIVPIPAALILLVFRRKPPTAASRISSQF